MGPCSKNELSDLRLAFRGKIIFEGLQVELDGLSNVLHRFVPRLALADATGK